MLSPPLELLMEWHPQQLDSQLSKMGASVKSGNALGAGIHDGFCRRDMYHSGDFSRSDETAYFTGCSYYSDASVDSLYSAS